MSSEKRVVNRGPWTIVLSELVLDKSFSRKTCPGPSPGGAKIWTQRKFEGNKIKTLCIVS